MTATGLVVRFTLEVFVWEIVRAMELIAILNHCYHHRGFVYQQDRFGPGKKSIEVVVPAAGGFSGDLLGVPEAGTRLRSPSRAAF